MLQQDWFMAKNFILLDEYFDCQLFFDTNTHNFYRVDESDDGIIHIREYKATNTNNAEYLAILKAYKDKIENL